MEFNVKATVFETYLPSPKHRKHRLRQVPHAVVAHVPEVEGADAPVAIIQRGWGPHGFARGFHGKNRIEYRWYAGQLWARPRLDRFVCHQGANRFATVQDLRRYVRPSIDGYDSAQDAEAAVREIYAPFLLIDGCLYTRIGEPRYVVTTSGLGHNHGGTNLMEANEFNPNLPRDRYYRIDQFDEAVAEAERKACARGDTKDIPAHPFARFEILMPEAVRLDVSQHGEGDPFLNRLYAVAESGAPPVLVAATAVKLALQPDAVAEASRPAQE